MGKLSQLKQSLIGQKIHEWETIEVKTVASKDYLKMAIHLQNGKPYLLLNFTLKGRFSRHYTHLGVAYGKDGIATFIQLLSDAVKHLERNDAPPCKLHLADKLLLLFFFKGFRNPRELLRTKNPYSVISFTQLATKKGVDMIMIKSKSRGHSLAVLMNTETFRKIAANLSEYASG